MFTSINPANYEQVGEYAELDATAIDERLARAAAAQAKWRWSSYEDRTQLLSAIGDAFEGAAEDMGRLISTEMGKTFAEAKGEVTKCASAFRYYAEKGPELLEPVQYDIGDGKMAEGQWHASGVVLAVMPWNFPAWQLVRALAPAIMAGNGIVLKHASNVQGTAAMLEKLVADAGAPDGLFLNLAIQSDAVESVIDDGRIVAATLTGSEPAGSAVAAAAGKRIKKTVLELGGSDAYVVMPSADLDTAVAKAVKARTQNAGQSCICGKRMIVHADIFDDFAARFTEAMKAITPGDPFDEASDIGPLSSKAQLETVQEQVEALKKAGADFLVEPSQTDDKGAFYSAGVATGIDASSKEAQDEIFGPVALLFKAYNVEDAITIANATPFGLGGAIFTESDDEVALLTQGIDTGMIAVNDMLSSAPGAPFGGVRHSGYGREMAEQGLHEFMNLKTVYQTG